jgi:hypothetical protein
VSEHVGGTEDTSSVKSKYYNQIVRVDGISVENGQMRITREMVEHIEMTWLALVGIRGFYSTEEVPEFCQSCDEAMAFLHHLTDKFREGTPA